MLGRLIFCSFQEYKCVPVLILPKNGILIFVQKSFQVDGKIRSKSLPLIFEISSLVYHKFEFSNPLLV